MFNISTFIVSQVNPHAVPFCWDLRGRDGQSNISDFYLLLKTLTHNAISNMIDQADLFGFLPRELVNMRQFSLETLRADIHIVAPANMRDLALIFKNLTREEFLKSI